MTIKFDALLHTRTWDFVPPSTNLNILGCKWILKTKKCIDGTLERCKAQLVVKWFHQRPNLDYSKTFCLVVKLVTIQLLISNVVTKNWHPHQFDVQNTFLHGDLKDEVFMHQPPIGFVNPNYPHYICKLLKSIYRLKHDNRAWFSKLSFKPLSLGFLTSALDSSIFIFSANSHSNYVLIYVDDIIFTASNQSLIIDFISSFYSNFPIKDLGVLYFFLGS